MQEVFKKLIKKLEEYENENLIEHDSEMANHCKQDCQDTNDCALCVWDKAIEIVKQTAEEFAHDTNVGTNGWIPVSEQLPKTEKWVIGFTDYKKIVPTFYENEEWYDNYDNPMNEHKIIAWQPLPEPYQPKGE